MRKRTAAIVLAGLMAFALVTPRGLAAQQQRDVVALARQMPDSLREQLRRQLADVASANTPDAERRHLEDARGLAKGYAVAWHDSLLIRMVAHFERSSARDRMTKVAADSLRRGGFQIFPRSGAAAAMLLWHDSRKRAASIGDSIGLAATLGNLGAGFLALDELDSARSYLGRARVLAERTRDWRTLGNALGSLGALEKAGASGVAAHAAYTRALAVRDRSGDDRGAAADQNNLGLLAVAAGDTAAARRSFDSALVRNRRAGRAGAAAVNLANLANLAIADGLYARASALYRDALALHRQAGERPGAGLDLRAIGGLELRQGKYRAAISAFTEAVSLLRETGPPAEAVGAQADLAEAYSAVGELGTAMGVLERAEADAQRAGSSSVALLALIRGDLAVDASDPDAAHAAYARAESLFNSADDAVGATAAQQGLGSLQLRRGDFRGAVRTLSAVAAAQEAIGDRRSAALTGLLLGGAMLEQGDTTGAAGTLHATHATLRRLRDPAGEAAAFGALGDLAARRGRIPEAETMYRAGIRRLAGFTAPAIAVRLHRGLGRIHRTQGRLSSAAAELQLAIDAVEQAAGRVTIAEIKSSMLGDIADIYAELALVEHARGRDAVAFETSERLRGRQLRDLIGRGLVFPGRGADPRVVAGERELRGRVDGLERMTAPVLARSALMRDAIDRFPGGDRQMALASARSAYSKLLTQLEHVSPEFATLLTSARIDHRDVAAHLQRDEALLEYLVTDAGTLLFVVTRDSIRAIPIAAGRRELAAAIDFARASILRRPGALTPEPWAAPLRKLYRLLIQPAETSGMLRTVRSLIIAPHAELHYLPFAALMPASGPRYLIGQYDITYVPSAATWLQLGARPAAPSNGKILVVAPFPAALPGSRDEAVRIAALYGRDATMMLGKAATARAFERAAPAYSTVHLATYGILNRQNPLFSYVAFAGAAGAERLEVQDVFGLSLRARLLILSACETGLGAGSSSDVPPGDDWVGLVRAFLFAGADNVMATLWPIEDRSTSVIMPRFYRSFRGTDAARSLALAQRAALSDPATAAPRHWAAFALVGAGK